MERPNGTARETLDSSLDLGMSDRHVARGSNKGPRL